MREKVIYPYKRRSWRGQRVASWALWSWRESFGSAEGRAAHWMCREKSDTLSSSPQTPCCSDALEYRVRNWFSFIPPTLVCHAVTQSQKWFMGPLELLRCGGTEATSSYCIWQRAHGCNLFLVRVNNFWMRRCGQAEAAVHHLGANNYFLTSVHSLSSGIHFISELQRKWRYRRRRNNRPHKAVEHSVCSQWTLCLWVTNLWRFLGLYRPLNQNSNTVTGYYHVQLAVTVQRNNIRG